MAPTAPSASFHVGSMTPAEASAMGIKLRESCDSCLNAKVKCSKGRPVCQRCLQNGHDCAYSPSARAGRKNRNGITKPTHNSANRRRPASIEIPPTTSSSFWAPQHLQSQQDQLMLDHSNNEHPFSNHSTQTFANNTPPLSSEDQKPHGVAVENGGHNIYDGDCNGVDHQIPTPPLNFPYTDPVPSQSQSAPVSASNAVFFPEFESNSGSPTIFSHSTADFDTWGLDNTSYSTMASNFQGPFDMIPLDDVPPFQPGSFMNAANLDDATNLNGVMSEKNPASEILDTKKECDCFADCLHALQQQHDKSCTPPAALPQDIPLSVILSTNREALRSCLSIMDCTNCSIKSGSSISTMLIATVLGKIISLYRAAVNSRSNLPSTESQIVLGSYTVTGEDKYVLENEILLVEVSKVKKAVTLYQDKCVTQGPNQDTSGIYDPLAVYLDKNLAEIMDFLRSQREHGVKR